MNLLKKDKVVSIVKASNTINEESKNTLKTIVKEFPNDCDLGEVIRRITQNS